VTPNFEEAMKHALVLATLLAASTAAAQPMPRPHCGVTILRAPDDVRSVIEQWVQAEPSCTTKLEIRVVPTEGGYYLLARDEHGRLRERLVPDAQSAGVLVASWVAADASAASTPYDVRAPAVEPQAPVVAPAMPPVAPPMPPVAPPTAMGPGEAHGPGEAPVVPSAVVVKSRWLALGAMASMSGTGGGGVRGEWDLKHRAWATLGISGSVSQSGIDYYGYSEYGTMEMIDTKVLGYLALTRDWGKWHLRGALGLGAVYTRARMSTWSSSEEAAGVFPTGELSLSLGRDITRSWGLSLGPVVSIYAQEYNVQEMEPGYYGSQTVAREADAMMYFALRHRL
jgi:hypothetical protein